MEWFLVIVYMTADGEVAGSERKAMLTELECRQAVDRHEPKVMQGNLWVRCEAPDPVQLADK